MRWLAFKCGILIIAWLCFNGTVAAQFSPAADLPGTTAIYKDSSAFVEWATGCSVLRGPMNIANPSLGLASAGDSTCAIGPAGINGTVSLGDGGMATLTFAHPVTNGDGFDFAVFENGFMTNDSNLAFLELAYVEVSTDGYRFVRFPAITDVQDTTQLGNGSSMDCSQLYNLAGKYVADYGTPFDLSELSDSGGIDINNINYIRIIDVVGSVDSAYGTRDSRDLLVNDPWPTPFASCGFDLDAVGVIHAVGVSGVQKVALYNTDIYPNPVIQGANVSLQLTAGTYRLKLFNLQGSVLQQWQATGLNTFSTAGLVPGIYFVQADNGPQQLTFKLVIE
jgi:hypothetical protein